MSITLSAYPMAFLINPEEAKNETLKKVSEDNNEINKAIASKNLKNIKVLTNLNYNELKQLMDHTGGIAIGLEKYQFPSKLTIKWDISEDTMIANLNGQLDPEELQQQGELFFQKLDEIARRNVRLLNSQEMFYYQYETTFTDIKEIYTSLKEEGATKILPIEDNGLIANLNNQSIKYFKKDNEQTYTLEVEQKITIMNINTGNKYLGANINSGLTNLKIRTNIKAEELREFLHKTNYLYYEGIEQTPLKNSHAVLNWVLKDGYYNAEFSGSNDTAITKEAEILFRKLNIAAGRDIRLIDEMTTTVYTYKTNYTDKGVLLNTLTEHGAEQITENNDKISCKLFGMDMVYYKKDDTLGYILDITRVTDTTECQDIINDLNDEYGLQIQEITYNKIKERLAQENMHLESETVTEDNSIILTIEI